MGGLARHSAAERRPSVPDLAPVASSSPATEDSPEVCKDDNRKMVWNHFPGCRAFADMGYCERFPPLAHRYCRLSCELCSPWPLGPPRAAAGGEDDSLTPTPSRAPPPDDDGGGSAGVEVGRGFGVSR